MQEYGILLRQAVFFLQRFRVYPIKTGGLPADNTKNRDRSVVCDYAEQRRHQAVFQYRRWPSEPQ